MPEEQSHVPDEPDSGSTDDRDHVVSAAERAARRRRLDEIFGDVLPSQTSDDLDVAERSDPSGSAEAAQDEWLRRQVPPHHVP